MKRYLLDTSTIIDYAKSREPLSTRLRTMMAGVDEFGICAVPIAEFVTGLLPHERVIWRPFFDGLHFWPISSDAAIQAGRWRWEFARRGTALSLPDALIAAVAWRVGAMVITNNLKDFTMPEISAISLR